MREKSELNQWKNVYSVIEWFKNLKGKANMSFIIFDIVNFYPTITLELLLKALTWAGQLVDISDQEKEIIIQAKKSLIILDGKEWSKKENSDFDVTIGSYDGAETCDIVGLYLLSELKKLKVNANLGGFRDDMLGVSSSTPRQVENIKKKICETYRKNGLQITIEANKKIVQFLDVELNLEDGSHKPFIKPNDNPNYVNVRSNHPRSITKNIPENVNKRLSALSSSETMFNSVAPTYQTALNKSGYTYQLKFDPNVIIKNKRTKSRKRQVIYFNPPYAENVKTNVGAKFLKLIDKHFPKNSPLHKIVNRNLVKISYRTTPSIFKLISAHNSKVLKDLNNKSEKMCSCPNKAKCPLQEKCLTKNLVYQATVVQTALDKSDTYVGLTATTFKDRLANHNQSFVNRTKEHATTLSVHIWSLKEQNIDYKVTWKIIDRGQPFSPVSGLCMLCTTEKYHIIFNPETATINKKDEINNACRHKLSVLLDKT